MINYENDYYGWTQEQAFLIKSGKFNELDIENLIEEIESMGKTEKKEAISRLTIVLLHLLKWEYQPERQCKSWKISIDTQRKKFKKVIKENPSLKAQLASILEDAYEDATYDAFKETGIDIDTFPVTCPWTMSELNDDGFYPG